MTGNGYERWRRHVIWQAVALYGLGVGAGFFVAHRWFREAPLFCFVLMVAGAQTGWTMGRWWMKREYRALLDTFRR